MTTISLIGGLAAALILLTLAACAGDGGGGGGTANVPTTTEQPASLSVPAGGTATLTVAATGNGMLTYQVSGSQAHAGDYAAGDVNDGRILLEGGSPKRIRAAGFLQVARLRAIWLNEAVRAIGRCQSVERSTL